MDKISNPKRIKEYIVPKSVIDIVQKRTEDLFYYASYKENSITAGIASVYMQGFLDGKETEKEDELFQDGSGI